MLGAQGWSSSWFSTIEKKGKVNGEEKMFNLFKCITIEGISIVEFLRQLKGKLEKHNYSLNPSMF